MRSRRPGGPDGVPAPGLLGEREGIQRRAQLDLEGIGKVLELRSQYGEPRKTLTDPAKYVDQSYYQEATRSPW